MFKIKLNEYKETRIYFKLFDCLLKEIDVKKELYLIDNGITPSSYRLARKQEQNIGKHIIKKLADKLGYKIPNELLINEIEDKFNKIYFDVYYKIYDDYDSYYKYIDDLLKEKYILFPLLLLMKLFLVANDTKFESNNYVERNREEFKEINKYNLFFNDSLYEIYEILKTSFTNVNVSEYVMKKFENGLFYFIMASTCINNKKYIEAYHFNQKCKEILLKEHNYKRLLFINFKEFLILENFHKYEECYDLAVKQIQSLKSFDMTGYEYNITTTHYAIACCALKKYNEIYKFLSVQKSVNRNTVCALLISSYFVDRNQYEIYKKEYQKLNEDLIYNFNIIEEFCITNNTKKIHSLNYVIDEMKDAIIFSAQTNN